MAELYREDISRHRPVLAPDDYDDPFEAMAEGRVPDLEALRLHTGTVWRWNRACYGVAGGVPHLRIENRVLPSGLRSPTRWPTPRYGWASCAPWGRGTTT